MCVRCAIGLCRLARYMMSCYCCRGGHYVHERDKGKRR